MIWGAGDFLVYAAISSFCLTSLYLLDARHNVGALPVWLIAAFRIYHLRDVCDCVSLSSVEVDKTSPIRYLLPGWWTLCSCCRTHRKSPWPCHRRTVSGTPAISGGGQPYWKPRKGNQSGRSARMEPFVDAWL